MSQENLDALRTLYEHWGRGDFREVPNYDPHVVLLTRTDLPDAERVVGVDSLRAYAREYLSTLTDVTWTAEDFIEADGSVVVPTRQRGRGTASGASVDGLLFLVWSFRGRAVIRLDFFGDRAEALGAVGLSE
jgi:ketosteroid isomerase-like protein